MIFIKTPAKTSIHQRKENIRKQSVFARLRDNKKAGIAPAFPLTD
jgi:hypothetical protein